MGEGYTVKITTEWLLQLQDARWVTSFVYVPYSAKFSMHIIFVVFADSSRTVKIKLAKRFFPK